MRYIFFGTPEVARATLAYLVSQGLVPVAVVTNPDAPKGRGHILTPSPVKEWAMTNGLTVLTPDSLDGFSTMEADLAVVVAYGKILPESLIQTFPKGVLNVHYSLLPLYRGAAPVEAALLNGDTETGVTIQRMVKKLDAGDIIASATLSISPTDTTLTLRERLTMHGAELLAKTLPDYLANRLTPVPQDETKATHIGKIDKSEGELDLSSPGEQNWRKYRAYFGGIGTYFFVDGKRIKITAAHLDGVGQFVIDRVIPEGGKEIEYEKFANR